MSEKIYDVFISHSSVDKKPYVDKLAVAINEIGLISFYDADAIEWGDSIKTKIDEGLKCCKRAIVVISSSYFDREWTEYELHQLMKRQDEEGHKIIMPILYEVTKEELKKHYPLLEDIKFIHARDYSYADIAKKLCNDILKYG